MIFLGPLYGTDLSEMFSFLGPALRKLADPRKLGSQMKIILVELLDSSTEAAVSVFQFQYFVEYGKGLDFTLGDESMSITSFSER
jgi:hypothetical protein